MGAAPTGSIWPFSDLVTLRALARLSAPDCASLIRLDSGVSALKLVPLVIDSAAIFRIDSSAMTEMHRDREMDCREEVRGDAQR